jgi:hypothetical protein
VDGYVAALASFDDGSGAGPALYAGGPFSTAGGSPANYIARWNGTTWTSLGTENVGSVNALAVYDDGSGPALYIGGTVVADGRQSNGIAKWRGCGTPGTAICFGDGTAGSCPCSNSGSAGHGCQNSAGTGGALLVSSGSPALTHDTFALTSSGELPTALSIFLQGTAPVGPLIFGDGLRCAGGVLKRLYVKNASGGTVTAPGPSDSRISVRSAMLGDPLSVGATRFYQTYYRDPSTTFCPNPPGNSWNVSSGWRVTWGY